MAEDPRVELGLRAILDRQWYEAHELLEDPWREAHGDRKRWLQGLIHGAVALEHLRRGNPRGCLGQWQKADAKLDVVPKQVAGVYTGGWRAALADFAGAIQLAERSRRQVAREPMTDLPSLPPVEAWPLPG